VRLLLKLAGILEFVLFGAFAFYYFYARKQKRERTRRENAEENWRALGRFVRSTKTKEPEDDLLEVEESRRLHD